MTLGISYEVKQCPGTSSGSAPKIVSNTCTRTSFYLPDISFNLKIYIFKFKYRENCFIKSLRLIAQESK